MTMHHAGLAEVVRRDPRYAYEAYEFVFAALNHTQKRLGRAFQPGGPEEAGPEHHVTGKELLEGVRDLALQEFGLMARVVFHLWGIDRTDDFGEIVFNLVESNLMSKTDEDTRKDFHAVFDLDKALTEGYRIPADGEEG
jgi:uncharacterized repeat protein (TIGR04138 family)